MNLSKGNWWINQARARGGVARGLALVVAAGAVWGLPAIAAGSCMVSQPADETGDEPTTPPGESPKVGPRDAAPPDENPVAIPTTLPSATPAAQPVTPAAANPAANPAAGATSPGHAVVLSAAQAIRDARTLSFTLSMAGEGASIAPYTPIFEASVRMMRSPENPSNWLVRASGTGRLTPKEQEIRFDVSWSVTSVEWLDHAEKKFYRRPIGSAKGKVMQLAGAARARELVEASPLSKLLKASSFEEAGTEKVDGVECRLVDGVAKRAGSKDRIAIGPDNLPRRMEMIIDSDRLAGRVTTNYTSLRLNDPMEPEQLRLSAPEGYESDVQEPSAPSTPAAKPDSGVSEVNGSAAAAPSVPVPPPTPTGPEAAPEVSLAIGGADPVALSSLKGNVVVLDFFGTWSLAARPAHAELKDMMARYTDKPVKVFSLAVREKSADAAAAYFAKQGLDWGVQGGLVAVGDGLTGPFRVRAYPTYCIVNKDGMVVARLANYKRGITMAHLAACVDAALEGKELPSEPVEPVAASVVPEVKVLAPDGSAISATGSINLPAKASPASNAGPKGGNHEASKGAPAKGAEDGRNTKVGVPTNTVTPKKPSGSGTTKDKVPAK